MELNASFSDFDIHVFGGRKRPAEKTASTY